jgi:hypothetical protein
VGSSGGATVVVEAVVDGTVVDEADAPMTMVVAGVERVEPEVVVVGESEVPSPQAAPSITRATMTAHHRRRRVMRRTVDGVT